MNIPRSPQNKDWSRFLRLVCAAVVITGSSPIMADPLESFAAGQAAFQSGNYSGAIKSFEEVLAAGPEGENLETILFSLAVANYSNKDYKKAEEYIARIQKEFPSGKFKSNALITLYKIQMDSGKKEEAEATLKKVTELGGDTGKRANLVYAKMLIDSGKQGEAADVLKKMVGEGIKDDVSVSAALILVEIENKRGNLESALRVLEQLRAAGSVVDNPLQLDLLAVQSGDALLAKKDLKKALRMYAIVRSKETVMKIQKERIEEIEKQIEKTKASPKTSPKDVFRINAAVKQLEDRKEALTKAMDQAEKQPDTLLPVRLRQARAYDDLGQKWETILVWESILELKDPKYREDGLFSIGAAYSALERVDDTFAAMDRYLKEFPSGKYASQADYMKGILALQSEDYPRAETVFGSVLKKPTKAETAEEMLFLMANAQFAQGSDPEKRAKFKDAIENYKLYCQKHPKGHFIEESQYRIPVAYFMMGDYAKALPAFQEYIKEHPNGTFAGDAEYRIAVCYQAADHYDDVLKLCAAWEKKYARSNMYAEVQSLKGDAYAAKEMPEEAARAYRLSLDQGETNELLQYALFEASKQLQKNSKWDEIADMFTKFAEKHPKHPAATTAVFWVSKARVKQGKGVEAKSYIAKNILASINDRYNEAVEMMLALLAQTCSKKPRQPLPPVDANPLPAASPSSSESTASATSEPSTNAPATPVPTPVPYDAPADLDKYINASNVGTNPLAKARLLYAQAELAKMTRKPDRHKELMLELAKSCPPDQMSARLLAEAGTLALENGQIDKARSLFVELKDSFPKSDLREFAYWGLGEVSLSKNKPQEALNYFNTAIDEGVAEGKICQITYGRGRALLALGKTDEAKKIFEQVAGTKEWRGEITAQSLLSLGELAEKKGEPKTAIQYYQRVFVAYQRYPSVVIPAYLKAADCFVKINEPDKAAAHLREMLSKPKLAENPLAEKARKMLEGLPAAPATPAPAETLTKPEPAASASKP